MTRSLRILAIVSLALMLGACGSSANAKSLTTPKAFVSAGGIEVSSIQEAALVVEPGSLVRISAQGAADTKVTIRPLVRPGSSVHTFLEELGRDDSTGSPVAASLTLDRPTILWRVDLRPNYYELDIGRARLGLAVKLGARPHLVKLPLLVRGTCQIVALRPVPPPAAVVTYARRMASSLGGSQPSSARYLLTTRMLATIGTGGGVVARSCNVPVYLVVLRGHFVAEDVPRPFGAKAPHGTIATATYSASGGTVTGLDYGLGSKPYKLDRLGRVGDLMPYLNGKKGTSKPAVVGSVSKL